MVGTTVEILVHFLKIRFLYCVCMLLGVEKSLLLLVIKMWLYCWYNLVSCFFLIRLVCDVDLLAELIAMVAISLLFAIHDAVYIMLCYLK